MNTLSQKQHVPGITFVLLLSAPDLLSDNGISPFWSVCAHFNTFRTQL